MMTQLLNNCDVKKLFFLQINRFRCIYCENISLSAVAKFFDIFNFLERVRDLYIESVFSANFECKKRNCSLLLLSKHNLHFHDKNIKIFILKIVTNELKINQKHSIVENLTLKSIKDKSSTVIISRISRIDKKFTVS